MGEKGLCVGLWGCRASRSDNLKNDDVIRIVSGPRLRSGLRGKEPVACMEQIGMQGTMNRVHGATDRGAWGSREHVACME